MDDSAKVSSLLSAGTTKKYDIPVGYLDFTYIEKCEDLKILEKIYKILKSGDEGFYPQLETCCEDKIRKLNPNSRILRKDNPLKTKRELETEEREELDEDLKSWSSDMKFMDSHLQTPATIATDDMDEDLPPIRSGNITLTANGVKETKDSQKSSKRVMPREYREWDKIDVDKELEKVDEVDQTGKERTFIASKEVKNTSIPNTVDAKGLTENEKLMKANREKDKGNEAFRSNDFKEAITYYSRSISLQATAASYNNRALAYLKSSEWQSAVADTNIVLKMEQDNVKALLRRGTAYKGLKQYDKARQDLFTVIKKEPNNKKAQELLSEIDKIIQKEKEERKKKGRRMVIEDVDTIEEKTKEEETVEESDVAPKNVETDNDCKGDQAQKKQSRRMQIQEVESDEEEENDTDQNVVNGHATVTELKAQNEKEVVINGHLESEVQNTVKQDTYMVKNDNKETNISDQNTENISKQSFKIEQKEEKTNEMKETQIKEEEIKEDENGYDDDDEQNEKEEGSEEEKSDEKESDKEEESIDEKVEETVELKRPVFYMRELPPSCVKLREEANVSFRAGQYGEAREKYTKVINALEKEKDQVVNLSLMYSNRAACQLKIGDLPGCVRDCTNSLHLIPHSVKPLLRRATAYEHLERYRLAYIDNRHVLLLDNRVDQAHLGTKRCQQILHQKDGRGWREKFQLPKVSHWEIPEIIGYDGKSTAPVVFTNPAPSSQSQTSCSVNSQSQKDSSAAVKSEPANTVNKANKQSEEKKLSPQQMFDDLKSKGNDHVKKSDFRAAIPFYSQCVDILPDQCVSYTNRALCYIRVNQPADAEEDCTKALSKEKDNVKALFRRAQARKMLKRYREGVEDLNHLLKIDTKNSAAKKELELMKNYWREELQNMKNVPKPETKPPPPASAAHGKGDKPRKRMVIEEVDSEDETTPVNKGKPASKSNAKPKPIKIQETKPKIEEVIKEPVSRKTESKPAKVKTETKDSKSSKLVNKKTQIRETSSGFPQVPRTVPKLEKATPYEFISIWNSLKKSDNVKPYYELLKQISPSDIKTVISNKIDGPMLNNITRCVAEHYIPNGELAESFQILKNLSEVPRFGTVSMFMTEGEKSEVKSVMTKLKKHTSSLYSPTDVEKLGKQFGV